MMSVTRNVHLFQSYYEHFLYHKIKGLLKLEICSKPLDRFIPGARMEMRKKGDVWEQ